MALGFAQCSEDIRAVVQTLRSEGALGGRAFGSLSYREQITAHG
jgi:hypothetical protein